MGWKCLQPGSQASRLSFKLQQWLRTATHTGGGPSGGEGSDSRNGRRGHPRWGRERCSRKVYVLVSQGGRGRDLKASSMSHSPRRPLQLLFFPTPSTDREPTAAFHPSPSVPCVQCLSVSVPEVPHFRLCFLGDCAKIGPLVPAHGYINSVRIEDA